MFSVPKSLRFRLFNDGVGVNSVSYRLSNIPPNLKRRLRNVPFHLNNLAILVSLMLLYPEVVATNLILKLQFTFTDYPTTLVNQPAKYFVKFNGAYFATPEGVQLISNITDDLSQTNLPTQVLNITEISENQYRKMKPFPVKGWKNRIQFQEWGTRYSWIDVCHRFYVACNQWEKNVIGVIDDSIRGNNFTIPRNTTTPFPHPTHTPRVTPAADSSSGSGSSDGSNLLLILGLAAAGFLFGIFVALLTAYIRRRPARVPEGDLIELNDINPHTPEASEVERGEHTENATSLAASEGEPRDDSVRTLETATAALSRHDSLNAQGSGQFSVFSHAEGTPNDAMRVVTRKPFPCTIS